MVHLYSPGVVWGCVYSHRGSRHRSSSGMLFSPHSALAWHPEEQNVPVVALCTSHNLSTSYIWHMPRAQVWAAPHEPHCAKGTAASAAPRRGLLSTCSSKALPASTALALLRCFLEMLVLPQLCFPGTVLLLSCRSRVGTCDGQDQEGYEACKGHISSMGPCMRGCGYKAFSAHLATQHMCAYEKPFCLKRGQLCNAFGSPLAGDWFLVTPVWHTSCIAYSSWKLKINVEWHAVSDSVSPAARLNWALLTVMQAWHLAHM